MSEIQHPLRLHVVCPTLAIMVSVIVWLPVAPRVVAGLRPSQEVARRLAPGERQAIAAFERRVKNYLKLRQQAKQKTPKLAKESTPEQIQAQEKAFVNALQVARAGAKPGEIFTPDIANFIRITLKTEFKSSDKKEIRKIVLDADTKGIPLQVNTSYPDPKEFSEVPPTVLLKLPTLPKEVRFRYVGRNLLLVDNDSNLIIDYMLDALP